MQEGRKNLYQEFEILKAKQYEGYLKRQKEIEDEVGWLCTIQYASERDQLENFISKHFQNQKTKRKLKPRKFKRKKLKKYNLQKSINEKKTFVDRQKSLN